MAKRLYRCAFTWEELIELERALDLIQQEDAAADCNMDDEAVRAKDSAMKKLRRHSGYSSAEIAMATAPSVPLNEIERDDHEFVGPTNQRLHPATDVEAAREHHRRHGDMDGDTCLLSRCALHHKGA